MLEREGTKTQSNTSTVWIIVVVTKAGKRESSDPEIYLTARIFVSTLWRQELRFGRELELRPLHKTEILKTEEDTEKYLPMCLCPGLWKGKLTRLHLYYWCGAET